MSTHEFTAADCTWADLHFLDLGEAFALSDAPDADIARIDRGIAELENQEEELAALVADCSMNALFD